MVHRSRWEAKRCRKKQKGRKDDRLLAQRLVCIHAISIDFVDLMMVFCCDALRLACCVKTKRRR
jgi:hypothetical protein